MATHSTAHYHPSSVCYGYAMARAFNREWSHPECPASTAHPNAGGGQVGAVDPVFFQFSYALDDLAKDDIIAFQETYSGSGVFGHVAYVRYVPPSGYNVDEVRVDQVPYSGRSEQQNLILADVIDGVGGLDAKGPPVGRYRKKPLWNLTVGNLLSDLADDGIVGIQDKPGNPFFARESPWPIGQKDFEDLVGVDAIMDGVENHEIVQHFQRWERDGIDIQAPKQTQLSITWGPGTNPQFRAVFGGELLVSGTKIIESGQTVTITPSIQVSVAANSELLVYGEFHANGTSQKHFGFTAPQGTTWKGIRLEGGGASNSSLNYCDINGALSPIAANGVSSLTISNVAIGNSSFYGVSPYWSQAAIALYNSLANITSTTINGQSDSWNGIRFAQGSGGSVSNSTIQNCGAGNGIVVQGGSYPTISYNTIRNNHFHGTQTVSNLGGYPFITNNTITDNGVVNGQKIYNGISFVNSSGEVRENNVSGSNWGVVSYDYSSVASGPWVEGIQGNNWVTDNIDGLLAYNNSWMWFGEWNEYYLQYFDACNKLTTNSSHNAFSHVSSTIIAQGAWWGDDPPDPNMFYVGTGSSIDYSYWRPYPDNNCWGEGGPLALAPTQTASITESSVNVSYQEALRATVKGQYSSASSAFRAILDNAKSSEEKGRALVGLYDIFRRSKDRTLLADVESFQSETGNLGALARELLAGMYVIVGDYSKSKELLAGLRAEFQGADVEKRALILLASLGSFTETERSASGQALRELKSKFESSIDAGLLAALGSIDGSNEIAEQTGVASDDFSLVSYPNPSNPTSQVRFVMPKDGMVSLKVFDVLGRLVATLIDEHRTAGEHQVTFDGSSMPTGVYFFRFEGLGRTKIQKTLLVK